MKKIFVMLLLACSAITIANAQSRLKRPKTDNTPTHVVQILNTVIDNYGEKSNQQYAVFKNATTGLIESKQRIVNFCIPETTIANELRDFANRITNAFMQDEPVSYQLLRLEPGNGRLFSIKIPTSDPLKVNVRPLRTAEDQDMWYMATKNPENPQLRDVYAISWSVRGHANENGKVSKQKAEGSVYMITSLRPDLFERDMEGDKSKTFTLDGRMGDDISDSLYVFYMADTYEELNSLTMMTDSYAELKEYMKTHSNILPMPVSKDKRFNISVDIDKRMGGRIRTVMPDGSLCKLWTNIDMVPGETYHITTHNGYYNEDADYERRLGRYTTQSMFNGHDNDDVELTGGYEDAIEEDDAYVESSLRQTGNKLGNMSKAQVTQELIMQFKVITAKIEQIVALYESIKKSLKEPLPVFSDVSVRWTRVDPTFKMIMKRNAELDKLFNNHIKTAIKHGFPEEYASGAYKEGLLKHYAEQTQAFTELYKKCGSLSKTAQKCQKQVNKLLEKNMKDMMKLTKFGAN